MATDLSPIPVEDLLPNVELLEEDKENMETDWHYYNISLLLAVVNHHLRGRDDYYAGGNQFIYFSEEQARNRDFRGPDFFFVWGRPREPLRPFWVVWREGGKYPDLIIELLSASTAHLDRTVKKDVYETIFSTRDYFCYDPDTQVLEGWRKRSAHYEALKPNEHGWLWCDELQCWLGTWQGKYLEREALWLRFYDERGQIIPHATEAAEQQAEQAQQHAEAAQQQAEELRRRAEAAEAELARLREQGK